MENNPLRTELFGLTLKNPVIAASGTFGFGQEYNGLFDVSILGGISGKGLTLNGSKGNEGMRIHETPAGLLNSIGLENPGVQGFIVQEAPAMRKLGTAVIPNLGGHSEEDYVKGAALLNEADIDILELNISCPNVKSGGMAFGLLPQTAARITALVKEVTRHPLLVKLSPNAASVQDVAMAVEQAGASGVSLVNTFLGMAIDVKNKRPVFNNIYAGLSGPAIRPLALRMVHEIAHTVRIPVIGMGGIVTAEDALSFIMAGATAVQVGSATFMDYMVLSRLIECLHEYCIQNRLKNIQEIRGII